ncbi:cyclase family protein [Sinorhizobium sp. BG8]|uniref:cyclase family protein n=1 Tax=Sinorhizobium sp. BG8 TaxID=2613773 RepID=UPI00193DBA03|nr:cyclase family protein [Sinorhizobium sp. BG8]QRM55919.1 cyclase family protein [Sinorhizobium sp. BG8]
MCDACVIDSVKKNMLSRRGLFRAAAAGAATVAAASTGALSPGLAASPATATDLTHELYEDFPTYFGPQQFFREQKFNFKEHTFNLFELRYSEHTGTHMDAPLHFSADGLSVAEIPVGNLVVPLAVIDIREKAASNPDAQVTPDDLKAWIAANGEIPENACVAMNSGWSAHLGTDKFRNADGEKKIHFPGFHVETVQALLETTTSGIAVDTLSLDYGISPDFATHNTWLPAGRWGLEAVANLDKVPVKGATIIVGAPKVRGGTGGPARVFALA